MQQIYCDPFYLVWAMKSHPISATHGRYFTDYKRIFRVPLHLHSFLSSLNTCNKTTIHERSSKLLQPQWVKLNDSQFFPPHDVCYNIQVTGFIDFGQRLESNTQTSRNIKGPMLWEVLFTNVVHLSIQSMNFLEKSIHDFFRLLHISESLCDPQLWN